MTMGISSIILMANMPAVILSVILGTVIGCILHLGEWINRAALAMQKAIGKVAQPAAALPEQEYNASLVTIIILFCISGTGIYGAITEGMSGESSILITKSLLDCCTAIIFACSLGIVVSFIAIPQFVIHMALFLCGSLILPFTTPSMIGDFKAVGGILLLATGFRVIRVKMFPAAEMIPAMVLAMPVSWAWTRFIAPLL